MKKKFKSSLTLFVIALSFSSFFSVLVLYLVCQDCSLKLESWLSYSLESTDAKLDVNSTRFTFTALKDFSRFSSYFSWRGTLLDILSDLDEHGVLEIIQQCEEFPYASRRKDVLELAFRRLSEVNPESAVQVVTNESAEHQISLISAIFEEWASRDFDSALGFLSKNTPKWKDTALLSILSTRDVLADQERVKVGALSVEVLRSFDQQSFLISPEVNPIDSLDYVRRDSIDDMRQYDLLKRIVTQIMDEGGLEAVATQVLSEPPTNTESGYEYLVTYDLIAELAYIEPSILFEEAIEVMGSSGEMFRDTILTAWAIKDPREALRVAEIASSDFTQILKFKQTILREWISYDPAGVIHELDVVPQDLRSWVHTQVVTSLAMISPEELLQLFADTSNSLSKNEYAEILAQQWMLRDEDAAFAWLVTDTDLRPEIRTRLLRTAIFQVALKNPVKAQDFLTIVTEDSDIGGIEDYTTSLIQGMIKKDIDEALTSLAEFEGSMKTYGYLIAGRELILLDQFSRALSLTTELPVPDRENYLQGIFDRWVDYNPQNLVQYLDLLSPDQQSIAAFQLCYDNFFNETLTTQELEHIKGFLTSEKLQIVEAESFITPATK